MASPQEGPSNNAEASPKTLTMTRPSNTDTFRREAYNNAIASFKITLATVPTLRCVTSSGEAGRLLYVKTTLSPNLGARVVFHQP